MESYYCRFKRNRTFVIEPLNKIVEMHNNDPLSIIKKGVVYYTPLAKEIVAEYVPKNFK